MCVRAHAQHGLSETASRYIYVLPPLVRNNEALGTRTIGRSGPKERVGSVPVVTERRQKQRVLVDRVNVTRHLMMIRVQLAEIFALVFLVILLTPC